MLLRKALQLTCKRDTSKVPACQATHPHPKEVVRLAGNGRLPPKKALLQVVLPFSDTRAHCWPSGTRRAAPHFHALLGPPAGLRPLEAMQLPATETAAEAREAKSPAGNRRRRRRHTNGGRGHVRSTDPIGALLKRRLEELPGPGWWRAGGAARESKAPPQLSAVFPSRASSLSFSLNFLLPPPPRRLSLPLSRVIPKRATFSPSNDIVKLSGGGGPRRGLPVPTTHETAAAFLEPGLGGSFPPAAVHVRLLRRLKAVGREVGRGAGGGGKKRQSGPRRARRHRLPSLLAPHLLLFFHSLVRRRRRRKRPAVRVNGEEEGELPGTSPARVCAHTA